MPRPQIKTNSQALRWCRTRRAVIAFDDWLSKGVEDAPTGVSCKIRLGKGSQFFTGKTLVKAVNVWIKHFDSKEE